MSDEQLKEKTIIAFNRLIDGKGYVASIDVFIELGILSTNDYENWRRGKVRYLEQVVKINLRKINLTINEIKLIAEDKKLKPSKTIYSQWGKKKGIKLQFSKNDAKYLEDLYSTHYIGSRIKQPN